MAKEKDDTDYKALADAAAAKLADAAARIAELDSAAVADQATRDHVHRLLWQCRRLLGGDIRKQLDAFWPRLRDWVGPDGFDVTEVKLTRGRP